MGNLTHTVSGDIASFRSAARVPIESLKCHFKPVQDLHGYSQPWIGGSGKNLITTTEYKGSFYTNQTGIDLKGNAIYASYTQNNNTTTVTTTADWYGCIFATGMLTAGDYKVHLTVDSDFRGCVLVTDENLITTQVTQYSGSSINQTVTLSSSARIAVYIGCGSARSTTVTDLQVEAGTSYTNWEPYENICPITGWTGLESYNITSDYDIQYLTGTTTSYNVTFIRNANGYVTASGTPTSYSGCHYGIIDVEGNETIYGTILGSLNNITFNKPFLYDSSGQEITTTLADNALHQGINLSQFPGVKKVQINMKRSLNNVYMSGGFRVVIGKNRKIAATTIPITFPALGINQCNPETITSYNDTMVLDNGVYKNTVVDTRTNVQISIQLWRTTNAYIKTAYVLSAVSLGRNSITFTVDDPNCHYICLKHNGNKKDFILLFPLPLGMREYTVSVDVLANDPTTIGGVQFSNIQLEAGNTAHTYEPYSSENTVYGGYINLIKGEIVAEWYKYIITGNEQTWNVSNNGIWPQTYVPSGKQAFDYTSGYCSHAPYKPYTRGHIGVMYNERTLVFDPDIGDLTYWKQYCTNQYNNGTPVYVVYKLRDAIHYPLSKQELNTFLNQNNYWSNANDITEVSYQIHDSNMIKEVKKNMIAENNQHYKRVIWNQIDDGVNADGWTPYNTQKLSVNFSDGIAECEVFDKNNGGYVVSLRNKVYPNVNMASKYYASYLLNPEYYGRFGLEYAGGYQEIELMNRLPNQWGRCSFMQQGKRDATGAMYMPFPHKGAYPANTNPKFKIKAPIYINLTQMFGTGNEPETIREFEALCKYNNINLNEYHPQNITGTPMTWIIPNRKKLNWNQYAPELSLDNYKAYNTDNTLTFENGELVITYGATYTDYRNCITTTFTKQYYQNHKYYVKQDFCPSWNSTNIGISICNQAGLNYPQATANQYITTSYILEKLTNNGNHNILLAYPQHENNITIGATCKVKNIILVDLTVMFGAGNEPATAAEFEALCEKNDVDLNRYWPIHAGDQQLWII